MIGLGQICVESIIKDITLYQNVIRNPRTCLGKLSIVKCHQRHSIVSTCDTQTPEYVQGKMCIVDQSRNPFIGQQLISHIMEYELIHMESSFQKVNKEMGSNLNPCKKTSTSFKRNPLIHHEASVFHPIIQSFFLQLETKQNTKFCFYEPFGSFTYFPCDSKKLM